MANLPCPKCQEEGKDTSGNGIKVYPDGTGYCWKGDHYYHADELDGTKEYKPRKAKMSSLTIEQVQTYPLGTSADRNIPDIYAKHFGVRHSVDVSTGDPDTVYYPQYEEGTLVGYKVKKLPKDYRPCVGSMSNELWGKTGDKPTTKYLMITEGEEDAMAARVMLSKSPIMPCNTVSLPNGWSSSLDKELEYIEKYKRVYLCLDDDPKGRKAQAALADQLAPMVEVRIVSLPAGFKDASDMLQAGAMNEFRDAIKVAEIHEPEGIVNGIDILLGDLLEPLPEGYPVPFTGLQDKLHGVRKGEIATVCAGSGIGKSTMVREITKSLIDQGLSVANVALEDQMNVAAQALIALDMNIPLHRFRFHPPSEAEVQPHYDKMIANGNTYFYKHFAGINSDSLMNKMYYYARSKAVDFIILDHLSLVISSSDSNNERKDIDSLMTNLAKLVVETGVGLIQIVHLKRTGGDKSFAKGGEVELTDLRGSAALEQLSWTVIGMERDQQGDDSDFSRIRVLKNRTFGFTGLCDQVKYDFATGRLKSVPPELGTTEPDDPVGDEE
jgi:twinkle protein